MSMLGSLRTSRLVAQLSALNDLDSPKAEKLIEAGAEIRIVTESEFLASLS